jgi:hypothetical protein
MVKMVGLCMIGKLIIKIKVHMVTFLATSHAVFKITWKTDKQYRPITFSPFDSFLS